MEAGTFFNVEVIIISITVFVVFYLLMMRHFEYWTRKGVVQIKPVPIFGNFAKCFFMKISPGYWFKEFYERSKNLPYMGVYILNQPGLMLRDPNIIKQILLKDFNNFADKFMESGKNDHLGNANLFIVKNPQWKILRTKISPVFTSGKLRQMFELMTNVGNNLDTYMKSLDLNGELYFLWHSLFWILLFYFIFYCFILFFICFWNSIVFLFLNQVRERR